MKTPGPPLHHGAFTMIELMVSTVLIALLSVTLLSVTDSTSRIWQRGQMRNEQFRQARDGFESITRRLSQATLNTYYEYYNAAGQRRLASNSAAFVPASYGRFSELRFASGRAEQLLGAGTTPRPTHAAFFQAPLGDVEDREQHGGLGNLLNTWGYFVEFGTDDDGLPAFIRNQSWREPRWRYRLLELREPSEKLRIYRTLPNAFAWFSDPVSVAPGAKRPVRVVADNIVALVLLPRLAEGETDAQDRKAEFYDLAPDFLYDSTTYGAAGNGTDATKAHLNSKHQLPPVIQVTMVAVDEISAARLAARHGTAAPDVGHDLPSPLFRQARNLEAVDDRKSDLQEFESRLQERSIEYRIFTTSVSLRGSKWSRTQTK